MTTFLKLIRNSENDLFKIPSKFNLQSIDEERLNIRRMCFTQKSVYKQKTHYVSLNRYIPRLFGI